jgi:hypothetical protein
LAFEAGLRILLDGIAQWAREPGVQAKPKRKTATR